MLFDFFMGLQEIPDEVNIVKRNAVKGISFDAQGKLLMIRTKKGDYKFPGGGMNESESLEETLRREFAEETGFRLLNIYDVIGIVEERNIDKFDSNKIFVMHSEYVKCEVDFTFQIAQKLDDYEKEQDFKIEFVSIEEAIKNNMSLLEQASDINPWVKRDTEVLKRLLK